jgi:nitric oxide reductase activation protein
MDGSNFMEKRIDPLLRMTLTDLARTLSNDAHLEVDFAYHSYLDFAKRRLTISFYWDRLNDERKVDGMKTDVYLRAFGQVHFTHPQALDTCLEQAAHSRFPSFMKQLVALMEEFRVLLLSCQYRPGMTNPFENRNALLIRFYRERYHNHFSRSQWLDALFCALFLRLAGRPVGLVGPLAPYSETVKQMAMVLHSLDNTADCVECVAAFVTSLPDTLADMTATYFTIRSHGGQKRAESPFKEAHALTGEESPQSDKTNNETHEDKLPTWHEEQEQEGQNFLQFDLDKGEKTDLLGEGERKMEAGDQAFANVQGEGTSRSNDNNRFDESPSIKEKALENTPQSGNGVSQGINRGARAITAKVEQPSAEEKEMYAQMLRKVEPAVRSLKRSLEKWLELKQTAPRNDLHIGRLGKKLTRIVTDEAPRLFYKKQSEDKKYDASFSLLVDCSASMHDKMEEVQLGVTLFHESLRALGIPHAITGFWEDALSSDSEEQPNYFLRAIDFERSLLPGVGSHILQLEPQEDNRDGFAIRTAVEHFSRRPETHKWLLVFTDGEPSAYSYTDGGILDTYEAVREARKKGIHVVGVFLTGGGTTEDELETMKDIYGRESLIIPSVNDIPLYMTPMLRKLLMREI